MRGQARAYSRMQILVALSVRGSITKDDLKVEVNRLEARLDAIEQRLTIKLGAFLAVAVGVIISVLRVSH